MAKESFYITTPIYYVNDIPHLGTAYCTVAADVLARFERLTGKDVHFLTGTDEHGEKVQEAATKNGKTPQAFTDEVSQRFSDAWQKLQVTNDDFIRTTDEFHKKTVQKYIQKAFENGKNDKNSKGEADPTIYLGHYEDWYCVPDETFWTESQIKDGKCPTCGRDVKKIKEENFFFKLAKFKDRLVDHIQKNPDFILPESKRNEVLAFLKEDLKPLSISRTSFTWGVPFPQLDPQQSPKHVVYVWFDALFNYVSALERSNEASGGKSDFVKNFWGSDKNPKAIHLVGKDILRFHAVYWPCFLMAVGLPLPKRIFAHGWWTSEGQKMSKSLGNVVEPISFSEKYSLDAFRLFMFREFPFGQDGDFSLKNFKERVNADLANNLGNLLNRSVGLINKNFDGQVFASGKSEVSDPLVLDIISEFASVKKFYSESTEQNGLNMLLMEQFSFHTMLSYIFGALSKVNKFVDTKAPWALAKDPAKKEELELVLNTVAEALRISALLLWPFIPNTSQEILRRLGQETIDEVIQSGSGVTKLTWGNNRKAKLEAGSPLFMRLE
jgi:methionyl-tRNA synthetase